MDHIPHGTRHRTPLQEEAGREQRHHADGAGGEAVVEAEGQGRHHQQDDGRGGGAGPPAPTAPTPPSKPDGSGEAARAVATARAFLAHQLGMTDMVAGPFRSSGDGAGEVGFRHKFGEAAAPAHRILEVTTSPGLRTLEGGFWMELPPGAGTVVVSVKATNAQRVRFTLTPTGTETGPHGRLLGEDRDPSDGFTLSGATPARACPRTSASRPSARRAPPTRCLASPTNSPVTDAAAWSGCPDRQAGRDGTIPL